MRRPPALGWRTGKPKPHNIDWSEVQRERSIGISLDALANKYGVDWETIQEWTKGKNSLQREKDRCFKGFYEKPPGSGAWWIQYVSDGTEVVKEPLSIKASEIDAVFARLTKLHIRTKAATDRKYQKIRLFEEKLEQLRKSGRRPDRKMAAEFLEAPIELLEFSSRSYTRVRNLRTVRALTLKTEAQVLAMPGMGAKSLSEIKHVLNHYGLCLKQPHPSR
jgi:hypothetical protein